MSLAMIGKNASYEFRWRRWALLRDVIATHLEDSRSGSRFPQFASIGRALGVGSLRIEAAVLATELRAIRDSLANRPVADLVLHPLTASVLYPTLQLDKPRSLSRTELMQVAPIGDETTLDQYFSSMLDSMLDVCDHPTAEGTVEVIDG